MGYLLSFIKASKRKPNKQGSPLPLRSPWQPLDTSQSANKVTNHDKKSLRNDGAIVQNQSIFCYFSVSDNCFSLLPQSQEHTRDIKFLCALRARRINNSESQEITKGKYHKIPAKKNEIHIDLFYRLVNLFTWHFYFLIVTFGTYLALFPLLLGFLRVSQGSQGFPRVPQGSLGLPGVPLGLLGFLWSFRVFQASFWFLGVILSSVWFHKVLCIFLEISGFPLEFLRVPQSS